MSMKVDSGSVEINVEEQVANVVFTSLSGDLPALLRLAAMYIAQQKWAVSSVHLRKSLEAHNGNSIDLVFTVEAEKEIIYPIKLE